MTPFAVNRERCADVAAVIRRLRLPCPRESTPPLPFTREEEANFWFFLGAICHQTSPIHGRALAGIVDRTPRRGWDFLLHTFLTSATTDRSLLDVDTWAAFTAQRITALFGDQISLPERRATLVRDLARGLHEQGWTSIYPAAAFCGHLIDGPEPNLLRLLSRYEAYSDPVQKKSSFFLALMSNSRLWHYADPHNLPAPVDYHEVRGHLRLGTVIIRDPAISDSIACAEPLDADLDVALRLAVRDALRLVATASGVTANALHYFLWNLFRTYCVRGTPKCDGGAFHGLPAEYRRVVTRAGGTRCPFASCCNSAFLPRPLNEHVTLTEYY